MTDPSNDDLDLVTWLADRESGLTSWEMDRIDEWLPMLEQGGQLTPSQRDTMVRAYERVSG